MVRDYASPFATSPQYTRQSHRDHVWFLINRAYQNIYGMNLPANPDYQKSVFDAALSLLQDPRSKTLDEKILMQACEDIIRVSDEHHRLAKKHASRASNPVYLRETVLDNAFEKQKYLRAIGDIMPKPSVKTGSYSGTANAEEASTDLEGRLQEKAAIRQRRSSEIMELAYQQLALSIRD